MTTILFYQTPPLGPLALLWDADTDKELGIPRK